MRCPNEKCINFRLSLHSKYCSSCGSELVSNPVCNNCERILHPTDKYCPDCGVSTAYEGVKR